MNDRKNTERHGQAARGWMPVIAAAVLLLPVAATAQEQDAESKALDSTATQWQYQFAYQTNEYKNDLLDNGQPRPEGLTDYLQLRIVAPMPFESFTLLPRLTIRHYENSQGQSGLGNTELFGLIIPKKWDWGSGRVGIGPLVTFPGDKQVARDEWGYGFAAAVVNTSGPWFYGLLFTQSWRSLDPRTVAPGTSDTNPLGIAPFLNYRLGKGWYIGNGDMVATYDWNSKKFYLPIGVRVGKVLVRDKGSWNFYAEYQTALIYKDWPGSAIDSSVRVNVTYTMPVGR
ncbi:MAG: hypothetical protein AMJ58_05495 [Gammaproteobacteria bacterium SG8_30]|nr:MAG: hypothetical protein AMJ58_05495 [Gammaproteobacteria bacterium SG8_30]